MLKSSRGLLPKLFMKNRKNAICKVEFLEVF